MPRVVLLLRLSNVLVPASEPRQALATGTLQRVTFFRSWEAVPIHSVGAVTVKRHLRRNPSNFQGAEARSPFHEPCTMAVSKPLYVVGEADTLTVAGAMNYIDWQWKRACIGLPILGSHSMIRCS